MGKRVVVLVGASGAGKSTWAQAMREREGGAIVSADFFFVENGVYRFDPSKLAEAHRWCLRDFTARLTNGLMDWPALYVDNTNATVVEAVPYIALALAHGWDVQVAVFQVDMETCKARNVHGTPPHVVEGMVSSIAEEWPAALPAYWRPENEPRLTIVGVKTLDDAGGYVLGNRTGVRFLPSGDDRGAWLTELWFGSDAEVKAWLRSKGYAARGSRVYENPMTGSGAFVGTLAEVGR